LSGSGATLAPLGVLGFMWSASSGLHNLLDVFDAALRSKARPYWEKRAVALTWVSIGLLGACAVAWLLVRMHVAFAHPLAERNAHHLSAAGPGSGSSVAATHVAESMRQPHGRAPSSALAPATPPAPPTAPAPPKAPSRHGLDPLWLTLLDTLTVLAAGILFLGGLYRFAVGHPSARGRRVWAGTLTAVGCWLSVSWAFGAYVASTADYALYYGSLAAVAVLLIWIYLSTLCLMVGAEVNALPARSLAMAKSGRRLLG